MGNGEGQGVSFFFLSRREVGLHSHKIQSNPVHPSSVATQETKDPLRSISTTNLLTNSCQLGSIFVETQVPATRRSRAGTWARRGVSHRWPLLDGVDSHWNCDNQCQDGNCDGEPRERPSLMLAVRLGVR